MSEEPSPNPALPPQLEEIEQKFPSWYLGGVKLVLLTLLLVQFLAMVWGIWETIEQAFIHAQRGLLSLLKSMIVNILLLLALLEVRDLVGVVLVNEQQEPDLQQRELLPGRLVIVEERARRGASRVRAPQTERRATAPPAGCSWVPYGS